MSPLGKIFLYIAAAGGVAVAIAGYLTFQQMGTEKVTLTQVQQAKQASDRAAAKAKQDADAANAAKDQTASQLTETQGKVEDLNTKLTAAQKQSDDLNSSIQAAKDAQSKAETALQSLNSALGGKTPDQIKADAEKAQQDLASAQSQQKILQDQVQASQSQIDQLKDAINRSHVGQMPPGISGKITFVNRTWNFVVLNIGLSNGIVPNGELVVYRGRDFLGKIKVTSAEASTAVADILPDAKADIQKGDDVLN